MSISTALNEMLCMMCWSGSHLSDLSVCVCVFNKGRLLLLLLSDHHETSHDDSADSWSCSVTPPSPLSLSSPAVQNSALLCHFLSPILCCLHTPYNPKTPFKYMRVAQKVAAGCGGHEGGKWNKLACDWLFIVRCIKPAFQPNGHTCYCRIRSLFLPICWLKDSLFSYCIFDKFGTFFKLLVCGSDHILGTQWNGSVPVAVYSFLSKGRHWAQPPENAPVCLRGFMSDGLSRISYRYT